MQVYSDEIFSRGIGAIQELARQVNAQQAAMSKLQDRLNQTLAEKEALLEDLAALEAGDQAREARLARIESSLKQGSANASYASVENRRASRCGWPSAPTGALARDWALRIEINRQCPTVAAPPTAVMVMGFLIVMVSDDEPGLMAMVPPDETLFVPLASVS